MMIMTGYLTFKQAAAIARNLAHTKYTSNHPVAIYKESDGSYSVDTPYDGRAKFEVAIDRAGDRYKLIIDTLESGRQVRYYEKLK